MKWKFRLQKTLNYNVLYCRHRIFRVRVIQFDNLEAARVINRRLYGWTILLSPINLLYSCYSDRLILYLIIPWVTRPGPISEYDNTVSTCSCIWYSFCTGGYVVGLHLQHLHENKKTGFYVCLEFSVIIQFVIVSLNNFYFVFPHYFPKYFYFRPVNLLY